MKEFLNEYKAYIVTVIGILLLVAILLVVLIGPKGLEKEYHKWRTGAYGSDWLVIEYTDDGYVMDFWELHNCFISNEEESDGIYFVYEENKKSQVVHISGRYKLIEIKNDQWEWAKVRYIKGRIKKYD